MLLEMPDENIIFKLKNLVLSNLYYLYVLNVIFYVYYLLYGEALRFMETGTYIWGFLPSVLLYLDIIFLMCCVRSVKKLLKIIFEHGRRSVFFFTKLTWVISIICFCLLIIYVVLKTYPWRYIERNIDYRFLDSIVEETDSRYFSENTNLPPDSMKFHSRSELLRYRGEDVQFTCNEIIFWPQFEEPYENQTMWKFNDNSIQFSSRFIPKKLFSKLSSNKESKLAIKHGLVMYNISLQLTIQRLQPTDFGNYTCHLIESKRYSMIKWTSIFNISSINTDLENALLKPSRLFQLKEFKRKLKTIRVPPGGILSFRSSFWYSDNGDGSVRTEYLINGKSSFGACHTDDSGCSKLVSVYWEYLYNPKGNIVLPFIQELRTLINPLNFKIATFYQCICGDNYGYHQVAFLRHFYNRQTKKYELVEALHPLKLLVLPRYPDMLDLHGRRSVLANPYLSRPTVREMDFVKREAVALKEYFELKEHVFIAVSVFICLAIMVLACYFLYLFIRMAHSFVQHQILYFLVHTDAKHFKMHRKATQSVKRKKFLHPLPHKKFDFYVSYSDEDINSVVHDILPQIEEAHAKRVCFRERDIPPNRLEIDAITTAVVNSQHFLIVLSPAYLEDEFRAGPEAGIINECILDRPSSKTELLVIKLAPCKVPAWLTKFNQLDWTTLTKQKGLCQLSEWVVRVTEIELVKKMYYAFSRLMPFSLVVMLSVLDFMFSFISCDCPD